MDHTGIDEFNAGAVFAWASLQPGEARAAWDQSYGRVVASIEELGETDFPGDSVDDALANNTYAHYAELGRRWKLSSRNASR